LEPPDGSNGTSQRRIEGIEEALPAVAGGREVVGNPQQRDQFLQEAGDEGTN